MGLQLLIATSLSVLALQPTYCNIFSFVTIPRWIECNGVLSAVVQSRRTQSLQFSSLIFLNQVENVGVVDSVGHGAALCPI